MRKILYFIGLILITNCIKAQDLKQSPVLSQSWEKIVFQGKQNNALNFWCQNNTQFGILQLDSQLNVMQEITLGSQVKNKTLRILSVLFMENQWVVFADFWNQKRNKNYLFANYVNSQGEYLQEWTMIAEMDIPIKPSIDTYFFKFSPDKQRFVVFIKKMRIIEIGFLNLGIHVFDRNFKQIYERNNLVGKGQTQFLVDQVIIDNQASVYLKIVENKGVARYSNSYVFQKTFHLFHFTPEDSSFYSEVIAIPEKKITDIVLKLLPDQSLLLGGYYSEGGFASMQGSFVIEYSRRKFELLQTLPFSNALHERYELPSNISKIYPQEMLKFTAHRIEVDDEGSVYIIGELIEKFAGSKRGIPKGSLYDILDSEIYGYEEILIIKVSSNGQNWEQIIPKNQAGKVSDELSFSYSFSSAGFMFAFNTIKKESTDYFARFAPNTQGKTQIIGVDLSGKITQESTFEAVSKSNPLLYRPMPFSSGMYIATSRDKFKKIQILEIK